MLEFGTIHAPGLEKPALEPISLTEIAPWALLFTVLTLLVIYFVGAEQGATSVLPGMGIHEFVHDGRHLLGFPCH